jgi:hypothetical protein
MLHANIAKKKEQTHLFPDLQGFGHVDIYVCTQRDLTQNKAKGKDLQQHPAM